MNVQLSTIRLARHNNRTLKKENERTLAFKSFNPAKAARIETELAKKGINCNFANGMCGKIEIFLAHSWEQLQTRTRAIPLLSLLSWICSTLSKVRCRGFAPVHSLCSLSGLTSFRPSANPLFAHLRSDGKNLKKLSFFGFFRIFNDGFVAECTQKVVNLFEDLFGRSLLPKRVLFEPSPPWIYGRYFNSSDTVCINSEHAFFQTMQDLKAHSQSKAGKFASTHPAQVYIHEFAHAAHWHHLKNTLGATEADRVWREFEGKRVPTVIGQFVTRFKLGNYALNANDMCEFAAERVTYDICNSITPETWEKIKNVDIGYSSIFDRRRTSTYLYGGTVTPAYYTDNNSPQASLDRYMQNT